MTFQAYLDTIKARTGLGPDDFRTLAAERGLLEPGTKTGAITEWLKTEYGLGPGHAMAIVGVLGMHKGADLSVGDKVAAQFAGAKAKWQLTYDQLLQLVEPWGDIHVAPTNTYVSILKGQAKFAVVATTADRFDIGIKLPGEPVDDRFTASGTWNSMVTHRVRLAEGDAIDSTLVEWLKKAYDRA